ncbi:MAG: hypothetical protein AB7K36_30265 [Chloroflexota bacterium]
MNSLPPKARQFCAHARWRCARILLVVALLLAGLPLAAPSARADEEHQGLQAGWAIDDQGNVNFTSSFALQNRYMHEAEASWIRLNFRLGACYQDWISRGCNGRTALETYDEVVSVALDHGFQVLGLVGHEAWPGDQAAWTAANAEHAGGSGDNPYLQHLSDDAVTVLATHYKDRIRAWEIWNEPNAWTEQDEQGRPRGGSFIYPSNFAWVLTHAYEAIKQVRPDAIVITGGLFGHDLGDPAVLFSRTPCPTGAPSGAEYLCATYEMGLTHAGWQPGRYPFDDIGQHIYIDGGGPTTEEKLRFYLDDVRDAYLLYEGPDTQKTTHITEFGWSTKDMSDDVQAHNLVTAFDTFRQVGFVTRAYWFHAQDVPEAGLFYGLMDSSGKKKRAFAAYQDVAAYESPGGQRERETAQQVAANSRPGARPAMVRPAIRLPASTAATTGPAPAPTAASPTPTPTPQPPASAAPTDTTDIVLDAESDRTGGGSP